MAVDKPLSLDNRPVCVYLVKAPFCSQSLPPEQSNDGEFVPGIFYGARQHRLVEIRCYLQLSFYAVNLIALQVGNYNCSEENSFKEISRDEKELTKVNKVTKAAEGFILSKQHKSYYLMLGSSLSHSNKNVIGANKHNLCKAL